MRKHRGKSTAAVQPSASAASATLAPQHTEAFTFGDPSPVLSRADILEYVELWSNGQYYEPPVSFTGLAKSLRAGTHHASALFF